MATTLHSGSTTFYVVDFIHTNFSWVLFWLGLLLLSFLSIAVHKSAFVVTKRLPVSHITISCFANVSPCSRIQAGPAHKIVLSSSTLPFLRGCTVCRVLPHTQRLAWYLQPPLFPSCLLRALKAPAQLHTCRGQHRQLCYWHSKWAQ